MEKNIHIRRAQPSDAEIIAQFNSGLAKETEHLDLDFFLLLQGVKNLLNDHDRGFYILAETENTICGQLMITYEWSDWRNGVFWWIQSVYVKPEFRGYKVFSSLYKHVVSLANKERNVCGLRLYVEKENVKAHSAYLKLGMKTTNYNLLEVDFVLNR